MPVFGGAGRKTMRTLRPVCNPMPVDRIASLSVRCWAMSMPYCNLSQCAGHRPPASGGLPAADVPDSWRRSRRIAFARALGATAGCAPPRPEAQPHEAQRAAAGAVAFHDPP
jgi:hypothetical protein